MLADEIPSKELLQTHVVMRGYLIQTIACLSLIECHRIASPFSMLKPEIFLSLAEVTAEDEAAVMAALRSGWVAPAGPQLEAFEKAMCERTGLAHAVGLSSGTAALHLGLRMAGVGPGDEVWVPSFTFIASVTPVLYQGASPVFMDSDETSWNMDPVLFAQAIEDRRRKGKAMPKALIAVHLYGQAADMDPIADVCKANGIALIEDTTEALGTLYKGRHVGYHGDIAAFSFNGNKIITTSGGGMLVTNRKDLADQARFLSTQARDSAPHYQHSQYGYNYRLSNILSALGVSQLSRLDRIVAHRRAVFARYKELLANLPGLSFMPEPDFGRATHWLSCIRIDKEASAGVTPSQVLAKLSAAGIEARPAWKPMHLQPLFAKAEMIGGAVCERIFEEGLCLPSGAGVSPEQQAHIAEVIHACFR